MANERVRIKIGAPILRPGVTLESDVSMQYVVDGICALIERAREFNRLQGVIDRNACDCDSGAEANE